MERVKKLFGAQDMTVGKPIVNISKFAIPLIIGNLAQQLYSTVDSIVVGKYCENGVDALSAIGASMPIVNLLLVIFMAISTGAGILVAQFFGAHEKERLTRCVGTAVTLIFVTSLAITAIGVPISGPLLRLISTPPEYYEMARQYLQIIFLGIIGGGFYNIISGILRGLGDSFYPLVFLIFAALTNIALDIWFVAGFGWGVQGVAWATIIAQGLSAALCLIRLSRMKDIIALKFNSLKPDGKISKQIMKLGLPSGLTQAIFSLAMITVQRLTNQMGCYLPSATSIDTVKGLAAQASAAARDIADKIGLYIPSLEGAELKLGLRPTYFVPAVNMAVMRVDGFAMLPNFTFGLAISTYIGQNIGARRMDRIKPGERAALKLSLIFSVVLVLCLILFGKNLISVFINEQNTDPALYSTVVELGGRALKILSAGYIGMAIYQIYGGILRAAGDTISTMLISLITTVVIRVPLAYLIAAITKSDKWPAGHPDALFISLLVSWVLGMSLTYLRYRQGKWRNIDLVGNRQNS